MGTIVDLIMDSIVLNPPILLCHDGSNMEKEHDLAYAGNFLILILQSCLEKNF